MSSKPAHSQGIFESQEAAFIENYDWLLRWALQFTNNDRARGEDLIQEVFAQFAFAQTDLSVVQDVRAYLYTTLKNTHVSAIRRAGRSHHMQSIVEYSVASAALGASDPYSLYQTQDELRRVCQYACVRKQSSRAGSVLILRYFLGYHLSEVGLVLGGTCQAVRQSLRFARNEARLFLDDPTALKFIDRNQMVGLDFSGTVCAAGELLASLRLAIFRSRQGECLETASLCDLYARRDIVTADNLTLAHIVSCPRCLDAANHELGLPLLLERHPADALGPNNNWRSGQGGGQGGGGGRLENGVRLLRRVRVRERDSSSAFLWQCQRRARELFEHYPAELRVSANGYILGSQSVTSETSRLCINITINEPLSFVEVMSEENARLLVMTVEPPPSGEPTQARRMRLSEGRYIEATLRHGHPGPILEVVYHDPTFDAETQIATADLDEMWATSPAVSEARSNDVTEQVTKPARLLDFLHNIDFLYRPFWRRPGFITAAISLLLVGALLLVRFYVTSPVTATGLLERAGMAESVPAGVSDRVSHRVINLEEINSGQVIARNRIEVWRDATRNLNARRVYDEAGRLIAGEWTTGGLEAPQKPLRTIYHHGLPPRIEVPTHNLQDAIRNRELWLLEPSAKDYAELVAQTDVAHVSEGADVYVIEYAGFQPVGDLLIQRATLTLRKSDLHAIGQTLTLHLDNETREYRFVETSFERPSARTVAPAVFEVDAELLSARMTREEVKAKETGSTLSASPSLKTAPVTASPELEVEVAYLLDQFRVRFGDQLSLTKTADGALAVQGIVQNDAARNEILQALAPILHNPAVRVEITTTNEAFARQERQRSNRVIVQDFAGADSGIPLYADLRRFFLQPGRLRDESTTSGAFSADERVDQEVRMFAARVVGRSRRALSHAIELKQLSGRFTSTELEALSPSARARWVTMVRNHAESLRRETSLLSGEIQLVFFANENRGAGGEGVESSRDVELASVSARLHRLVLANDEVIRSGFAASSGAATGQAVKTPRFWVSLLTAERLAESVLRLAAPE